MSSSSSELSSGDSANGRPSRASTELSLCRFSSPVAMESRGGTGNLPTDPDSRPTSGRRPAPHARLRPRVRGAATDPAAVPHLAAAPEAPAALQQEPEPEGTRKLG
ncbi:hypothetical protein PVAP13_6KG239706 [Panicum virgatum]|uniref:Uncharacterized protein n=1 Tax=Panicum virgatum TaxID=38727 RepID=A0A8T0RD06_PANVG|nr:hypothetical protein PVAP13_6KG239706 [Panicum virgatum]